MITTGCEGCCFLHKDDQGKGCVLNQLCALKNGKVFAPGYCRMCRSHKWAKRQHTTDVGQLYQKVIEERALRMDLLVFFDESRNTIEDLRKTLDVDWYVPYTSRVIIMDVTGFGNRQNIALQYLKTKKQSTEMVIDSSALHESFDHRGDTVRRLSKQVKSPFFMAIPAGNAFRNFQIFAEMIQHVPSRVIHWSFPFTIGTTAIAPLQFHYGLFITAPYRALMTSSQAEPFMTQLKKEEAETEMGLTWFCTDCWLI